MSLEAFKFVFSTRKTLSAVAGLGLLSLALALYAQHVDGHEPCALCMLSRLLMIGMTASALVSLCYRSSPAISLPLQSISTCFSYAGIYWSIFHMDPVSRMGCGLSKTSRFLEGTGLDSALPWLLEIRAMCAGDLATWFGLSFPTWGLFIYSICAAALTLSIGTSLVSLRKTHETN